MYKSFRLSICSDFLSLHLPDKFIVVVFSYKEAHFEGHINAFSPVILKEQTLHLKWEGLIIQTCFSCAGTMDKVGGLGWRPANRLRVAGGSGVLMAMASYCKQCMQASPYMQTWNKVNHRKIFLKVGVLSHALEDSGGAVDFLGPKWILSKSKIGKGGRLLHKAAVFGVESKWIWKYSSSPAGHSHPSSRQKWEGFQILDGWVSVSIRHEQEFCSSSCLGEEGKGLCWETTRVIVWLEGWPD